MTVLTAEFLWFLFNEDLFLHHKAGFEAKTQNSGLDFLYTHVSVCSGRQKVPKSDFQSQFSMPKIIRIFLIFFH